MAYSRTWTDTGPHFYKRCQERADAEADPGMKHKLLRLGRKLKEVSCSLNSDMFSLGTIVSSIIYFQVDDDVKRHNDLIEVIKKDPSEILTVVTRRRKDFTTEFFVHVRALADSYYENPEERNGMNSLSI